jgi:hypothetical protein
MPAKYVQALLEEQKNDFRDAEAVQRLTMEFVATNTAEQIDLQALQRARRHHQFRSAPSYWSAVLPCAKAHPRHALPYLVAAHAAPHQKTRDGLAPAR